MTGRYKWIIDNNKHRLASSAILQSNLTRSRFEWNEKEAMCTLVVTSSFYTTFCTIKIAIIILYKVNNYTHTCTHRYNTCWNQLKDRKRRKITFVAHSRLLQLRLLRKIFTPYESILHVVINLNTLGSSFLFYMCILSVENARGAEVYGILSFSFHCKEPLPMCINF